MQEILLIGFYQPDEALTRFLEGAQQEFNLPVRCLWEQGGGQHCAVLFSVGLGEGGCYGNRRGQAPSS